jgi:hypothetical protein
MSYFLITSKNTLPEQFREGIEVTNKTAIAEKLILESFLTQENYIEARMLYASLQVNKFFRLVEDYTVISITCVNTEQDANVIVAIFNAIRDKNASQIGRTWTHPEDPNQYVISSISADEWIELVDNLSPKHVPVNIDSIQFY